MRTNNNNNKNVESRKRESLFLIIIIIYYYYLGEETVCGGQDASVRMLAALAAKVLVCFAAMSRTEARAASCRYNTSSSRPAKCAMS
jgi:hypothetical protein